MRPTLRLVLPFLLTSSTLLVTQIASAHISVDAGGTHLSRYGDDASVIKDGPCGVTGGPRGENVYTYKPGEKITLSLVETISHPSYFRISFDDDGDDGFIDPQTINPPYRQCMTDPADKCGADDFYNSETVLMDDLDIHNYDLSQKKTWSWDVELPNVECNNCTLQVIQVMEDPPPIHAPYTPGTEDIYYQCVDMVLKSDAPAGGGGDGGSTAASSSGDDSGGCSFTGRRASNGGLGALGLLSFAVLALRRRSARN